MRFSKKYNVWVDKYGTTVYREYKNQSYNRYLQIHKRTDGSKYLSLIFPGTIELDLLVADCFNPKPRDGNGYVLIHKDGDLGNCNASNLLWEMVVKSGNVSIIKRKLSCGLTVASDGKFYDGKTELPIVKEIGDADTDRIVAIDPYACYNKKNSYKQMERRSAYPDVLMAWAGFVNGDMSGLNQPVVLHRDNDYLNFNSNNLEWVEENSHEYQCYKNKKRADINDLTRKLNPNKPFIDRNNINN